MNFPREDMEQTLDKSRRIVQRNGFTLLFDELMSLIGLTSRNTDVRLLVEAQAATPPEPPLIPEMLTISNTTGAMSYSV